MSGQNLSSQIAIRQATFTLREDPPPLLDGESGADPKFPWGSEVGDQGAKDFGQKVEYSGATLKERATSLPHMREWSSHEPSAASLTLQDDSVAIRFQDVANPHPDIREFLPLAPSMTVQQIVQILDTNNESLEVKLRRAASGTEKQDPTNLQKAILGYVAVAPVLRTAHPQAWPDIAAKLLDHVVMYDRLAQIFVQENLSQGTAYPQPLYQMFLQFMTLAEADVPLIRNALSATYFLRQRLHTMCLDDADKNASIRDGLAAYHDFTCDAHVQEKTAHILKYCGVTRDHFLHGTDITKDDDRKLNADLEQIRNFLEKLSPYLDREHRFLHSSIDGTQSLSDQILQVVGAYDTLLDIAERGNRAHVSQCMESLDADVNNDSLKEVLREEKGRVRNVMRRLPTVLSIPALIIIDHMPILRAYHAKIDDCVPDLKDPTLQEIETSFGKAALARRWDHFRTYFCYSNGGKISPRDIFDRDIPEYHKQMFMLAQNIGPSFEEPLAQAQSRIQTLRTLLKEPTIPDYKVTALTESLPILEAFIEDMQDLCAQAKRALQEAGFTWNQDTSLWDCPEDFMTTTERGSWLDRFTKGLRLG